MRVVGWIGYLFDNNCATFGIGKSTVDGFAGSYVDVNAAVGQVRGGGAAGIGAGQAAQIPVTEGIFLDEVNARSQIGEGLADGIGRINGVGIQGKAKVAGDVAGKRKDLGVGDGDGGFVDYDSTKILVGKGTGDMIARSEVVNGGCASA